MLLRHGIRLAREPSLLFLLGRSPQRRRSGRQPHATEDGQDDAVLHANRPLAKSGRAHIVDIVPTLLAWLGEPVPAELDGTLLVAP